MKEAERLLFLPQIYLFTLEELNTNLLWRDTLGTQLRLKVFENCFSRALKKKKKIHFLLRKKLWKNRRYVVLIRGKEMAALSSILLGHPNILMALDCAEDFREPWFLLANMFWSSFCVSDLNCSKLFHNFLVRWGYVKS